MRKPLNLTPPNGYANKAAGDAAPTAASPSQRFPFTATPSAGAAAALSNVAAATELQTPVAAVRDERGRQLVEQGAGSVVVSKFGDDVLLGIECNGRNTVRLSTDTALLVAEHIRKLALRRPVAPASGAAAAAQAVDQAHTPEAGDGR